MPALRESLSYRPEELKFGTSGLRALVSDMTDLECYINTAGFLNFLDEQHDIQTNDVIYVGGDLRDSTPRITGAVIQAVTDAGYKAVYCGLLPTPALAFYALQHKAPCIMVTGSHIPADRNGIKFYKSAGEVLKSDESSIKEAVAAVRAEAYAKEQDASGFDAQGALLETHDLPEEDGAARELYMQRYVSVFGSTFADKKIVFYQHSAVGRDLLTDMLRQLGAEVVPVGRSDVFIPIDTENVTPENHAYFKQLAQENPDTFAIVSTDGDSDRPFVIDERGVFHRGDDLGAVVADWLKADFAAYPVSSNDAVDTYLNGKGIEFEHTKIGSPYVVVAMQGAAAQGKKRVTGWEVNGGFLLGEDIDIDGKTLEALPTRDAIFPIIVALRAAVEAGTTVSDVFAKLPQRFTEAGLIDDFPTETSQKMVATFAHDDDTTYVELEKYFTSEHGFGKITKIDSLDGVRIFFDNGDIAHLRPSGNAPQLRIYGVADTQERANQIVALAIAEPNGIFRTVQAALGER